MSPHERLRIATTCQQIMNESHWHTFVSRTIVDGQRQWRIDAMRHGQRIVCQSPSHSLAWMEALQKARRIARLDRARTLLNQAG